MFANSSKYKSHPSSIDLSLFRVFSIMFYEVEKSFSE